MNRKKVFSLFIVFIIAIGIAAFLYFRYWQEPEARYLETGNAKLIQVRKDLSELKAQLREEGLYGCCIRNDCNWCALYMGHCPCMDLVTNKGDEKSCPECAAAWNRKQGKVVGVDSSAIKVTTFGVYGYEEGGHHFDSTEKLEEDTHQEPHH